MAEKEYIDKQDAIKEIYRFDGYLDDDMIWRLHYAIRKIPAADVRPKRYARKTKFFNEPWTGSKFTTCTACYGKVGPHDKFCKHCGAKFEEGE